MSIELNEALPTMQKLANFYLESLPSGAARYIVMHPTRMNEIWNELLGSTEVSEATKRQIKKVQT